MENSRNSRGTLGEIPGKGLEDFVRNSRKNSLGTLGEIFGELLKISGEPLEELPENFW